MLKDLVKIANKLDSLGLTKIADEIDGMIKKAVDSVDSGDMGSSLSPEEKLRMKIMKAFGSLFAQNPLTLKKIVPEDKRELVRAAFEKCILSEFMPRAFFEKNIVPAYNKVKAFTAPNIVVDAPKEISFSDVESYLMQVSFAMKEYKMYQSSAQQISDSSAPTTTPSSPASPSPQMSSSAAKTWEQYVAKTGKFGPQVQQAWMVYCATRRLPETYDAFVSWWKTQKAAGKFVNGGSPEETFMMLSSLTRNSS